MVEKIALVVLSIFLTVSCQDDKSKAIITSLCTGKEPLEFFRLSASDKNGSSSFDCRNVVQCTDSGLQGIRCPPGLAFDVDRQTCDWKNVVDNCDQRTKKRKVQPLLVTDEPLCQENFLACGNQVCIERGLFCNGVEDCDDGSDENSCDVDSDPNRAPACDKTICKLPDCFCSEHGTTVPGNLCPEGRNCDKVPQMVTITFDDAINHNNIELYRSIFNKQRLNPNGCDIKGTFFVSHKYSNYRHVQEVHEQGHEIAAHSITHEGKEDYWSEGNVDTWAKEMGGARIIIDKFANISDNSVIGMRAPYLRVGGNQQFTMMEEQGFLYDSSLTAPLSDSPQWPYTMYFRMPHTCHGYDQNCPSRSHAVWEMVMNELDSRDDDGDELRGCAMVDTCSNIVNADQFYDFLVNNFYRYITSNRAPLGLYFHAAYLVNRPEYLDAFLYWIDEVLQPTDFDGDGIEDDVYFVTMTEALEWIQNPQTMENTRGFAPWLEKCNAPEVSSVCETPNSCQLSTAEIPGEALYMQTCLSCPREYPWFNDPTGSGIRTPKNINKG